jgi:hypothetical protein
LLEEVLPQKTTIEDFKMKHDFPSLGRRTVLLNARRLKREPGAPEMILLAFENVITGQGAETKSRRRRTDSTA